MNEQMQDLARRAVACKPWQWMGGMLTLCGVRVIEGGYDYLIGHRSGATRDGGGWVDTGDAAGFLPDLTDSATLGCLLALVREAWGEKKIGLEWEDGDSGAWLVNGIENNEIHGQTESEALVAALEAAP